MMLARTIRPASSSASTGDTSAGRSGPQQASSTTTAGGSTTPSIAPPAPPTAAEVWAGAPVAETTPRMEATPPATAGGEAAPAASAGTTAGAPSVELAAEEVAAETPLEAPTASTATAEVPPAAIAAEAPPATGAAEVPPAVVAAEAGEAGGWRLDAGAPSSGPQPVQGDESEVVHGRHLLPSPVEVSLPRLLVKAQRAMEEAEAGFRREWEKLEAERLWLSNWKRQLGNRIQVVSSRTAEERAKLE
jgi:hypothetical protein